MPGMLHRTIDDVRWRVLPEWNDVLLGSEGLRLERRLRCGTAQIVNERRFRAVYSVDLGERKVFVKHQRPTGILKGFVFLLRGSAARRD